MQAGAIDPMAELTAMRSRGEIDAEEFKLAKKYLEAETAKMKAPSFKHSETTEVQGTGIHSGLKVFTPPLTKSPSLLWIMCVIIGLLVLLAQCTDTDKKLSRAASASVLDQAAVVFRGNYSRGQIKSLLDEVMEMNGVSRTELEYDRWTNVLVVMRQDSGATEMEILRCIRGIQSTVPFPASAGICAAGKTIGSY